MARYRFWLISSVTILVALVSSQVVCAHDSVVGVLSVLGMAVPAKNSTCKVYSLADLGDDPKLCKWVAETIPEMIQPASWRQGDARLSYFAPSKLLVVNNTPAVQGQVEEFLQNLRKTLPQQAKASVRHDSQVMPAQFAVQDPSRPLVPVQSAPAGYPIPPSPVGPKHLFHFIIRYEGEGIIDSNVAKFAKALVDGNTASSSQSSYVYPPPSPPPDMNSVRGFIPVPMECPIPVGSSAPRCLPAVPSMPPADAPQPTPVPPPNVIIIGPPPVVGPTPPLVPR